jgi:hypothetical protein
LFLVSLIGDKNENMKLRVGRRLQREQSAKVGWGRRYKERVQKKEVMERTDL